MTRRSRSHETRRRSNKRTHRHILTDGAAPSPEHISLTAAGAVEAVAVAVAEAVAEAVAVAVAVAAEAAESAEGVTVGDDDDDDDDGDLGFREDWGLGPDLALGL